MAGHTLPNEAFSLNKSEICFKRFQAGPIQRKLDSKAYFLD